MQFAFLVGSLFLLLIWFFVWLLLGSQESRNEIVKISAATSILGLTEPIFVPEYWNPPTLLDLAQKTGFDIESVIFAFAVGGIAASVYEVVWRGKHKRLSAAEMQQPRHRFHLWALLSAPVSFLFLYVFTALNPIYSVILAMIVGAIAVFYCRPDLIKKMVSSAFIFVAIYSLFFLTFNLLFPGYTKAVWNLEAISGILVFDVPVEEIAFAFGLGLLWSGVYEHQNWFRYEER